MLKNRIKELEKQSGTGFYIVFGKNEEHKEKEILEYCNQNKIDINSSTVIWVDPMDVGTL